MKRTYIRNKKRHSCVICSVRCDNCVKRITSVTEKTLNQFRNFFPRNQIQVGSKICTPCRGKYYNRIRSHSNLHSSNVSTNEEFHFVENDNDFTYPNQSDNNILSSNISETQTSKVSSDSSLDQLSSEKNIVKPLKTYSTHRYCFICKRKSSSNNVIHKIQGSQIVFLYIDCNILVSQGARCCSYHFDQDGRVLSSEIEKIKRMVSNFVLDQKGFQKLLYSFKVWGKEQTLFTKFKYLSVSENLCLETTGFNLTQIRLILEKLKSLSNSKIRTREQCLVIYLFWLKHS